ncbi:MAG: peptidylprolyl isomerase [Cytophagales bacterium]|nr:peptidylprolyl isomerase [Bernardetiaceae bacterium]MDW8204111.1 peptidylprolyl isomerase [Cytophagales bacterium]
MLGFFKRKENDDSTRTIARIYTSQGMMEAGLFTKEMPITTAHFIRLVESEFYNGLHFFRYIPEVLIQTGCPYNNGMGTAPNMGHIAQEPCAIPLDDGVLAMPHTAPHLIGSQFFICLSRRNAAYLEGACPAFAKITTGSTVMSRLRAGDTIQRIEIVQLKEEEEKQEE